MTEDGIVAFFARYAEAFTAKDGDAIAGLWDYPALMSSEGRQTVVDRAQFEANVAGLLGFYAGQGVDRAEAEVVEIARLTETTASARVDYRVSDKDGGSVARWEHVYVLSDTADGIRICVSLPDDELRVWRERGALPGQSGSADV